MKPRKHLECALINRKISNVMQCEKEGDIDVVGVVSNSHDCCVISRKNLRKYILFTHISQQDPKNKVCKKR